MPLKRVIACALFMLCLSMAALPVVMAQPRYSLKHYTTSEGLLHDRISCILKDKEGFIWLGTWDGLNRFDGHTFVAYKGMPGDSSSLENNKIRIIAEDSIGYLWVKAYDNRIYRFNKKNERFLPIQGANVAKNIRKTLIESISPLTNGDTWLLSLKQGALCASGSRTENGMPVITVFNKKQKGAQHLSDDHINCLYEDQARQVWLGTAAGVCCLKKASNGEYTSVNLPSSYSSLSFTTIKQYGDVVYMGTQQGKVITYNLKNRHMDAVDLVPGTLINALLYDGKGLLYAATSGKGLVEYNVHTHAIAFRSPGEEIVLKIYRDSYGLLWLQPRKGILKYDPATKTAKLFTQKKDAEALTIHTTYQVFEDTYNTLWVCMVEGGFGYYNRAADKVEYFHDEPGSPDQKFSNVVTVIYHDPAGVLWFSGYDRGINKVVLLPDVFKQQLISSTAYTKTDNEVRALCEDHAGRLWMGNKSGDIYIYKNDVKLGEPLAAYAQKNIKAYCIYETRDHTIWIGTKGQGLIRAVPLADDGLHYRITQYTHNPNDANSVSNNSIYTILEDHKGRMWLGTFGGGLNLVQRDGDKLTFTNPRNAFAGYEAARANGIRHLQEDPKGNIWIASTNGLLVFNPADGVKQFKYKRYTKQPGDSTSLGNNDVQYICRDAHNNMWLGTFGGGLQKANTTFNVKDKITFKVYTTANGLPNDIILSIVNDRHDHLWLTTENGLSEFNTSTQVFKNYNTDDGLPPTAFSESAAIRSASGRLYLGCIDGFLSFDPEHTASRKYTANMALTNFQVANKIVVPAAEGSPLKYGINDAHEINLKYDQNLFTIDYTVLDYKIAHKIWYAYKLEGFDSQWNMVRNQRQAFYTNVPPGKYTFRVKTVSNYLFKNVPEKSVVVIISPPFWKTGWAYLVYFILAVVAIEIARRIIVTMITLRNRVTVEQKLAELKLQFFTNISHELRTPLTLIVNPLEQVLNNEQQLTQKGREHLSLANKNANRMVRFINQLLDFRKLQSGSVRLQIAEVDLVALLKQTVNYFTELAVEKQISLTFKSEADQVMAWVDAEKIDIVIYNLLANAFKFTPQGRRISITLVQADDIYIRISDEGPGVPEDKLEQIFKLYYEGANDKTNQPKGTGIGLAFSRELITNHGGQVSAQNNPGAGMTFTIALKAGKAHFEGANVDLVDAPTPVPVNHQFMPATATDAEPVAAEAAETEKPLVLIVEDNPELRKFLSGQLSTLYRVELAEDGAIGLQKAEQLIPDLIISDVMMPNMDGIAMLDALKNQVNTSHIPVVLLTARSSVEHQIEGLKFGADFYVTKPFNTGHVIALVENLIKQRRQLFNGYLSGKSLVQLAPGEILITPKDEQLLKQAIEIVEQKLTDADFNIDDVASAVGLGRTTFYKKLKSLTGMAPVEFVKEMRLKRAVQLMETAEYNISEISYLVGFGSLAYFSTCFKEKYGSTPSQYLKQLKQKQV
ncbi:two component regulator with propeller domain [Mucilaginibacter yixingensis]|uniref:histidine kinase n=1 Tax=Mucilaginibacter yixingensis TaxID=1295612 RepID=A0A2T5JGZ0_9SPHI|nr:two-component regulator propeller domain-containing protein [Mucilaginibacter yixingensis]PTR01664.1 two component regulator with propeller domain [Mucilaginibacter yixingensis]